MTASAQGIDVSSYQPPLTPDALKGLAFAFCKATNGDQLADAHFARNWAALKAAGIRRGAYHELISPAYASGKTQAQYFLATVIGQGLEPGDMLAVVASDYGGVTDSEVKAWCDTVRAAAPTSPVLVYSDLSAAEALTSCTGYDLWAAWPSDTAPASVSPWKTWRFWQWGTENGVDRDAHNGTGEEMGAWLDSVASPAPAADWTFGPPQGLTAHPGHTSVRLTWEAPAGAPEAPARYSVFIYAGDVCDEGTMVKSYPRQVTKPEFTGGSLQRRTAYTAHVVAEGPDGTRVAPGVYASAAFTTG
jgi:GH25 family lysozyme M1 (1,4-beta-N-acetylmuramidase)